MNRARAVAAFAALAALAALAGGPPSARAAGPTPTIASLDPVTGLTAGGTLVTILGTDFVAPMQVTFGGTPATSVSVVSPTQLTCTTPPHARGAVDVVVTQAVPPPSPSAPLVGGFTFVEAPARVWVPRAPGDATGGNPGGLDVAVVDWANRAVVGSVDLNPGDPDLPTDTSWRVSQVLFDGNGDHAFLATEGTPGTLDSQKIFIVRSARVLGTEAGPPVIATIDTDGNPYQIALSADGKTLYAADAGSWQGSATLLPNGTFRVYDVTDRAAPVLQGTATEVGILPVLAYDRSAYGGWGTNSSFTGLIQSKNSRCVVTNVGSHTLSVVDVATRNVIATADAGVPGGGLVQLTTSIPSPFSDDLLFVQTTEVDLVPDPDPEVTRYFVFRVSTATLDDRGDVATPIQFFPLFPVPDVSGRGAWPHPDGLSLVAIPSTDASVATWKPSTGSAAVRTAIQGGGPPSSLAYNDAKGFFYAREADGGWTVFSVPATRSSAPVQVKLVPEATGADSLRVVGDGTFLVATAPSALLIVDGNGANATAHEPVATVALPLDPLGGPAFPQPGPGAARNFVTVPAAGAVPRILDPLLDLEFGPVDPTPAFVFEDPAFPPDAADVPHELEISDQPDFIRLPGASRLRLHAAPGVRRVVPSRAAWLRVLRGASGDVERPFYARVNRMASPGFKVFGTRLTLLVPAPPEPTLDSPTDGDAAFPGDPPTFEFTAPGAGRYWVEFAGDGGFAAEFIGRVPAGTVSDPDDLSIEIPADAWRRFAEDAIRLSPDASTAAVITCRVRLVDGFRRSAFSPEIGLEVADPLIAADPTSPAQGTAAPPGSPPTFVFGFTGPGRYLLEFAADGGFNLEPLGGIEAAAAPVGSSVTFVPPAARWRDIALAAVRRTTPSSNAVPVVWRVRLVSEFGRTVVSPERTLEVAPALVLPDLMAPADGAAAPPGTPPNFEFTVNGAGRYRVEVAGPAGFPVILHSFDAGDAAAMEAVDLAISLAAWKSVANEALRRAELSALPKTAFWRVRYEDPLGRSTVTPARALDLDP